MNLKEFLYRYKHALVALYFPIYMVSFTWLEQRNNVTFTNIHCIIDDYIPFCEWFIIPYMLWFLYVLIVVLYLFFQADQVIYFYRTITLLFVGMSICLIIYALFPNAQNMRPTEFTRDNVFIRVIKTLYQTDTDTNVCPSIHVYNSIVIHMGLATFPANRKRRTLRVCSLILCILICLSTVFLKQHSFLDGVAAVALYAFLEIILRRIPFFRGTTAKEHKPS